MQLLSLENHLRMKNVSCRCCTSYLNLAIYGCEAAPLDSVPVVRSSVNKTNLERLDFNFSTLKIQMEDASRSPKTCLFFKILCISFY